MKSKIYTEEFKKNAIDVALKKGIKVAAKELGCDQGSISNWKKRYASPPAGSENQKKSPTSVVLKNTLRAAAAYGKETAILHNKMERDDHYDLMQVTNERLTRQVAALRAALREML